MSPKYISTFCPGCWFGLLPKILCETLDKEVCLCHSKASVNSQNDAEAVTAQSGKRCSGLWHLQRTLHIHHRAPSSDLPVGPFPGSYTWNPMQPLNAGSRGSRKGTLLLSPQTTGPPWQACFPGWVSANIPRLSHMTLRELWGWNR